VSAFQILIREAGQASFTQGAAEQGFKSSHGPTRFFVHSGVPKRSTIEVCVAIQTVGSGRRCSTLYRRRS
jgi:hypothetical protein